MRQQTIAKIQEKKPLDKIVEFRVAYFEKHFAFLDAAVSTDETRFFLNCIYWDKDEKTLVSSDGRRLHLVKFLKHAPEGLANLPSDPYLIEKIDKETYRIAYRLDGKFPNYKKIIPDGYVKIDGTGSIYRKAYSRADFAPEFIIDIAAFDKRSLNLWEVKHHPDQDVIEKHSFTFEHTEDDEYKVFAVVMPLQPY